MTDQHLQFSKDSRAILKAAIRELEVFALPEASLLEMGEDGRLKAAKETRLKRIISLARFYVAPFISGQLKNQQKDELHRLKNAILEARDTILKNSALIEECKHGTETEKKFAEYAMSAIQRYNSVVSIKEDLENYTVPNFHRQKLLLDPEIQGQLIELPRTISIKFDSYDKTPAKRIFNELSQTLKLGALIKGCSSIASTHKKIDQFMMDSFRMKALRMVQTHLEQQSSITEILELIRHTPIEMDETDEDDCLHLRQLIELGPGALILLTGSFKQNRHSIDPKFMAMPILDSFRLSSQVTHTGFPFPEQHIGWVLGDKWVEANPLRFDQVPLYHKMEQNKKSVADRHLYDPQFISKIRALAKQKREVFDHHRTLFVPLHRHIQKALRQGSKNERKEEIILDAFYEKVLAAPSAFDMLTRSQQQIVDIFIKKPFETLESKWLKGEMVALRQGLPGEKLRIASIFLEQERYNASQKLNKEVVEEAYILQQGSLLGETYHSVGLQYLSEKMGFAPPFLSDSERQLQASAFQQLLTFIDECDSQLEIRDPEILKNSLLKSWLDELKFLKETHAEEEEHLAFAIADELEFYFNSRFYARTKESLKEL